MINSKALKKKNSFKIIKTNKKKKELKKLNEDIKSKREVH